jgi:hypothetical protein
MSRHVHRSSTARLLPALAATLVLVLSGCGSEDDTTATDDTSPSESTSESASELTSSEPLALTADGSTAGKCAMPSAEVLSTFDTAFEGTVTSVEDGTATLEVGQWYAGGEASTVTVEAPGGSLDDLLMAVDFQEGQTYLVSADGDRVTLCGFTAETTPELETMYAEAFPTQG